MTNPKDTAMPIVLSGEEYEKGLTKREYFAAMAMQGIISSDHKAEEKPAGTARAAVLYADALIKALNDNAA